MNRCAQRVKLGVTALAAAALLFNAVPVTPAFAYFNFGTVSVSPGAGYLQVTAGSSTATNVNVSPASHAQTQGCGMAKCPQVCDSEGAAAGYHCADANGQCTCAGKGYSTYYAQTSASSSNPGVASAYMSGNTLYVTGNAAGTATITISSSLRQWSTGYATVTVQVDAPPQPEPAPAPTPSQPQNSGNGNTDNGNAGNAGNASGAGNAGNAAGAETPKAAQPSASGIPEAAKTSESTDDKLNEEVVETEGGKVTMVEANSHLKTADELKKIAGKKEQLIIWSGSSSDQPDYSWTFWGEDVKADDPNLDFDPSIDVSATGTGAAANITKQAKDALVLEFAHQGKLPGKATLTVKAGDEYPDGTELSLFRLDGKKQVFKSAQKDQIKTDGGYFAFKTSEGGTFAVSTDDLASYQVIEENTPGAAKKQKAADDQAAASQQNSTPLLVGACVVVVAAIAVVAALVIRRKKGEAAIAQRVKDAETQGSANSDAAEEASPVAEETGSTERDEAAEAAREHDASEAEVDEADNAADAGDAESDASEDADVAEEVATAEDADADAAEEADAGASQDADAADDVQKQDEQHE